MDTNDTWDLIKHQLNEIVSLLDEGLSEIEVAERVGVALNDWYKHKKTHPEFAEAIASIRTKYIKQIDAAIYRLALGIEHGEVTTVTKTYPNGDVEVTETVVERRDPPNLQACREILNIIELVAKGNYDEETVKAYNANLANIAYTKAVRQKRYADAD